MAFRRTSSVAIVFLVLAGCSADDDPPDDQAVDTTAPSDDEVVDDPAPGDAGEVDEPPPGEQEDTDGERLPVEAVVDPPPLLDQGEAIDAADTPEGAAELELVAHPTTIGPEDQVELRLVNRGEVSLWHGWWVDLQRWTGHEWVDAAWPDGSGADDVLESLRPGEQAQPRRWPGEDAGMEPGWYRVTWEAHWEDDRGASEPVELRARASFEVASPPSDDHAPAWYVEREPMPSCGTFGLDEMALDNAELEEANRCLLDAFESGEPAELQVAQMTDEGDPIIETYRVIATGELEMMADHRQDDFGNTDFTYAVCTDLYEDRPRGGAAVRVADCVYDEERTVRSSSR